MTLTVPADLTAALQTLASQRRVSVEDLLREVIASYLRLDESLREELAGWQAIGAEALELVDKKLQDEEEGLQPPP